MAMDRLAAMQLFVRIVERRSFSAAASDLGVSRAAATETIKRLEARLGARLLVRTTRHVTTTLEGEEYHHRCQSILADVEQAEGDLATNRPRGTLRISVHGYWARTFLIPHLPTFMARFPDLDLFIDEGDRFVDMVREGFDCVLRHGDPVDSSMMSRLICRLPEVTCASPDYLARHGVPASPDDLEGHSIVGFASSRTGGTLPLEFLERGCLREVKLPCRVRVIGSETMVALARQGFGLMQAPRFRLEADFSTGNLVEVLPEFAPKPTPVFALFPQGRQFSPRIRVFLNWLGELPYS
ncbi:LysR family transcriptional regulator [Lichenicoccus sp.]|uniref:LysR family transcriptional regulator n=1 Tax=Lichenicoccus sp. TaxID=2781899 RepID=UPI003D0B7F05